MKTTTAILISACMIIIAILFVGRSNNSSPVVAVPANNVSIENGKQIITINVKGGYTPQISTAKANLPTILRFKTNGAFDCSSSIFIPSLGYRTSLPFSGTTDLELPLPSKGIFRGMCGMGMYNFSINFE